MSRSSSAEILSYVLKAAAALIAVFLFFEGTVRTLGMTWTVQGSQPDDWVGTNYAKGTVVRWSKEGFGTTRYVADGEIATPFDEGTEIVVLGDSHTAAWQIDDRYKYVSVAETLLWQRGRRVNLRNFGAGGLSFADEVYRAGELCKRNPRPAALVIQVSDTSFFSSSNPSDINYFRKTLSGGLELVHRPADPSQFQWRGPWWRRVRLLAFLRERRVEFFPEQQTKKRELVIPAALPPTRVEIAASVSAQAQLLVNRIGNTPVIFLRAPWWPYAEPNSAGYIAFRALGRVRPWPMIDPGPELERFVAETHHDPRTFANTLPLHAHLNRYGDAILGRLLADEIERMFYKAD